jgi:hypothetical protein
MLLVFAGTRVEMGLVRKPHPNNAATVEEKSAGYKEALGGTKIGCF